MKNVQGGRSACSGEHLHLLILPLTCSLQFNPLDVSDTECTCAKSLSQVQFFESLWTVAHQAPLSMGFSRQEYWSGLPRAPPGDLPNPGIEPTSLKSLALVTSGKPLDTE